jgi:nucleoid DNA-binding protein
MSEKSAVLNRSFFVSMLAANGALGGSKAQLREVMEAFLDGLIQSLKQGMTVQIKGLGRFSVVESPARTGCNLKTGEPIAIPARRRIKFKASKSLLEQD